MPYDYAIAIDRALTPEERKTFLRRFCDLNPHWIGAHVADVLDHLVNSDAHLNLTEPFDTTDGWWAMSDAATIALHYLGVNPITLDAIQDLVTKAESIDPG